MPRRGRRSSSWNSLRALGPVLRCAIVVRGDSRCAWCGFSLAKEEIQIDHVTPREQGGLSTLENLVPACARCNDERDPGIILSSVREQIAMPIDRELRDRARALTTAWYPWHEARAQKNRARQVERDHRRRARRPAEDYEDPPF